MNTLAIILAGLTLNCVAAQAEPCILRQVASLEMSYRDDGTITVPIGIAGRDRTMLLDISQNSSGVTRRVADDLHLQPMALADNTSVSQFGLVAHAVVVMPSIQIGVFTGTNAQMLLFGDDTLGAQPPLRNLDDVDGVIGLGLLGRFDLEFDFQNARLKLFEQDHCAGAGMVHWAAGAQATPFTRDKYGMLGIAMQLDGKAVNAHPVTRQADNTMGLEPATELFGLDKQSLSKGMRGSRRTGQQQVHRYPFKSLTAPGIEIADPAINLVSSQNFVRIASGTGNAQPISVQESGGELRIGTEELRKHHLFFAFKEGILYVTPAGAHR